MLEPENNPNPSSIVDYFHQLDDPYSHLAARVLATFAARYDVVLRLHLIRASGGASQPELEKLAVWARRDAELIAPHLGLSFPKHAVTVPEPDLQVLAGRALVAGGDDAGITSIFAVSEALWSGDEGALAGLAEKGASDAELNAALDRGSDRVSRYKHYSGAMFWRRRQPTEVGFLSVAELPLLGDRVRQDDRADWLVAAEIRRRAS